MVRIESESDTPEDEIGVSLKLFNDAVSNTCLGMGMGVSHVRRSALHYVADGYDLFAGTISKMSSGFQSVYVFKPNG
jgi:hypothetical protein